VLIAIIATITGAAIWAAILHGDGKPPIRAQDVLDRMAASRGHAGLGHENHAWPPGTAAPPQPPPPDTDESETGE
jgi:hypothetical protein